MTIRPIAPADLPQFFALLVAKAEFDGALATLRATPESLAAALFSNPPLAHALVAEVDGRLVGMATYCTIFSTFIARPGLWLDDLYVDTAHRSQRIGRRLVQALCRRALASGCGRVDWHVSTANPRGVAFYRGLGATVSESIRLVRLDGAGIAALAAEPAPR